MFATKRLQKELSNLHRSVPPGVSIASTPDFTNWKMDIQVLDENPLYKGQTYRLNFKFSNAYPIGSSAIKPRDYPSPHPNITMLRQQDRKMITRSKSNHLNLKIEAPEVTFISEDNIQIPMHPHIYSNGVICLDLLGSNWSPVQNVESVCMSIQSMLTGNSKNERPPGNDQFVRTGIRSPRNIRFVYEDENV